MGIGGRIVRVLRRRCGLAIPLDYILDVYLRNL